MPARRIVVTGNCLLNKCPMLVNLHYREWSNGWWFLFLFFKDPMDDVKSHSLAPSWPQNFVFCFLFFVFCKNWPFTPLCYSLFVIERKKDYLWREKDRSRTIWFWTLDLAFGGFTLHWEAVKRPCPNYSRELKEMFINKLISLDSRP